MTSLHPGYVIATEMLPMPKATTLSEAQLGGRHCPWCGGRPAMALGVRLSVANGALLRWKPRACRACTQEEAARVHRLHVQTCARCTPMVQCQDARALHALSTQAPASGRGEPEAG